MANPMRSKTRYGGESASEEAKEAYEMADMGRSIAGMLTPGSLEMSQCDHYPSGLIISLTEEELSKLQISDDYDIGDMIHIDAFAKVISVSKEAGFPQEVGKPSVRVSLQITKMSAEEAGDVESAVEEAAEK